jgi:hypothetical protein
VVTRDLSEFSWHTGGPVRALAEGERRPALFRDLGPAATLRLLRGELPRLAGPTSPVTYARTVDYTEPYSDHERFGRLALLPWGPWRPWHSGLAEVFVADAETRFDPTCMALAPDDALARIARESRLLTSASEAGEVLGRHHGEWLAALADRLEGFTRELAVVERAMAPLRRAYQSARGDERARSREWMAARGLDESDLCAPWHHLPRARRDHVVDALSRGQPWR